MVGLAGGAMVACLSDLDERDLAPGAPVGGAAGASSGGSGAGDAATSGGGTSGAGTSSGGTSGGGASGGSAGTVSSGAGGSAGSEVGPGGAGAAAGSGPECTGELLACEGGCVDATTDNAHCGECLNACGAGSTCVAGECECPDGQPPCADGCVNTLTDSRNCGGCGEECPADQSCVAGDCACSGSLTPCSDGCVDTGSNSAHCGGCGRPCDAGQVCSGGVCSDTCGGSEVQCGNDCADTQTSAAYCGNCETECTGVDVCVAGECVCPDMQAKCDGRCVDTDTDNLHCGRCGTGCSGGTSCVTGECRCPSGQTDCSGTCKSLMTDAVNCGSCGNECGAAQTCEGGECRCPAGLIFWNGECVDGSPGCNTQRSLNNGSNTIQSGGNARSFMLRAPSNYDSARPYRLVLAYHAFGTTAAQVDSGGGSSPLPYYGHSNLAQSDTIFVAPQSLNDGSWSSSNNQDLIFTDAILTSVRESLCIDETRIFATGFSVGASMAYALACARPDVFRAVAAFSGGPLLGCSGGTSPVAFYASHGVNDATIIVSSGRQMRDKFVQLNGCNTAPEPTVASGMHACTTYAGCSAGHPVEWCAFSGDHLVDPRDSGQSTSWNPARSWAFITQF